MNDIHNYLLFVMLKFLLCDCVEFIFKSNSVHSSSCHSNSNSNSTSCEDSNSVQFDSNSKLPTENESQPCAILNHTMQINHKQYQHDFNI